MFQIKICGITSVDDAISVARAGADAVGLNFYAGSPRYVPLRQAGPIVDALPDTMLKVGLFVNAAVGEICEKFEHLRLDLIQLHGDEPPAFLSELGDRPVMRAFRLGPEGLDPVDRYLAECRRLNCTPCLTLIDACVKGKYGGSGQVADWQALKTFQSDETVSADTARPPLVLAGGLTSENVAAAISTVRPAAVDTASGVESSPPLKDPAKVAAFVRAAREGFDRPRVTC